MLYKQKSYFKYIMQEKKLLLLKKYQKYFLKYFNCFILVITTIFLLKQKILSRD